MNLTKFLTLTLKQSTFLRLKQEQVAFCDRIAAVMGLTATEMAEFKGILEKDKSGHGRALKSKFTVGKCNIV